jgi:hypothetical protein
VLVPSFVCFSVYSLHLDILSPLIMATSSIIDLEKLILRFPKVGLRGTMTAQLHMLGLPSTATGDVASELDLLERTWIRRGQNLRLELVISIDGEPLAGDVANELEDVVYHSKVMSSGWCGTRGF